MNKSRFFVIATLSLCTVQALLILVSWIVSAVFPTYGFNSLLSGSGIRWLSSCWLEAGCSELTAWFLFGSFFVGTFVWSGLPKKITSFRSCGYNEKFAMVIFFFEMIAGITICLFLALYPHSPLLGITGTLYPGPFLKAAFFVLGATIFGGSVTFSMLSGRIRSCEDAAGALVYGLKAVAPLLVVLFLLKMTVEMACFVLQK